MSRNKTLIATTAIVIFVAAGIFLSQKDADHSDHSHSHKPSGITAKLSAGVKAHFEMLTEEPAPNKNIEVVAKIESLDGGEQYEYVWHMPDNTDSFSPTSGQLVMDEDGLGETLLRFAQTADYDMKIHLEIRKPGSDNSSMFTLSTLNFHQNQLEVERLQERQSKYKK